MIRKSMKIGLLVMSLNRLKGNVEQGKNLEMRMTLNLRRDELMPISFDLIRIKIVEKYVKPQIEKVNLESGWDFIEPMGQNFNLKIMG